MASTRKITDPRDLLVHELGEVMTLAQTVQETSGAVAEQVSDEELRDHVRRHGEQAGTGLERLQQVFSQLGADAAPERSPAIEGLRREHDQLAKRLSDELRDGYEAATAAKTHHLAVASYTPLVAKARALGQREAAGLLEQNLKEERALLTEVEKLERRLAKTEAQAAA